MSSILTLEQLEATLFDLDADALDHLGVVLRERSRLRRMLLTAEAAEAAIHSAPLTPAWARSQLADVGRIRIATRLLIEHGWHPDQIRSPLIFVALDLAPHPLVAVAAVDAGIEDAFSTTETDQ